MPGLRMGQTTTFLGIRLSTSYDTFVGTTHGGYIGVLFLGRFPAIIKIVLDVVVIVMTMVVEVVASAAAVVVAIVAASSSS